MDREPRCPDDLWACLGAVMSFFQRMLMYDVSDITTDIPRWIHSLRSNAASTTRDPHRPWGMSPLRLYITALGCIFAGVVVSTIARPIYWKLVPPLNSGDSISDDLATDVEDLLGLLPDGPEQLSLKPQSKPRPSRPRPSRPRVNNTAPVQWPPPNVTVPPAAMPWPLQHLTACRVPQGRYLRFRCRNNNKNNIDSKQTNCTPAKKKKAFFFTTKEQTPPRPLHVYEPSGSTEVKPSAVGAVLATSQRTCHCATVIFPKGNSSANPAQPCLAHITNVTDGRQLIFNVPRECGSTECGTFDAPEGMDCMFRVLTQDLPSHSLLPGKSSVDSHAHDTVRPLHSVRNVPTLCSNQSKIHRRYRELALTEVVELFPEQDAGLQPRLHGLVELPGGCFRARGCKSLGVGKVELKRDQESCTGYAYQETGNGRSCLHPMRAGNRVVCNQKPPLMAKEKGVNVTQSYGKLWVGSVAPWNTFQHLVIDKVGPLTAAWLQAKRDPDVSFLLAINKKGYELTDLVGIPRKRIVPFHSRHKYCAEKMYVDTPLPGGYGRELDAKYPRPPEVFSLTAQTLYKRWAKQQLKAGGEAALPPRDLVVWLDRGEGSGQARGTNIQNVQDVLSTVECYVRAHGHKLEVVSVDAGKLELAAVFQRLQRARVIMGVHGGQMANIVFARPDKGTAVIEVVGRQLEFKSYSYGGMAAGLDYHYVPRLCLVPDKSQKWSEVRIAWGKQVQGKSAPYHCGPGSGQTYVYADLDDITAALASALGDYKDQRCDKPSLVGQRRGDLYGGGAGVDIGLMT